jgi:hypothetical protein
MILRMSVAEVKNEIEGLSDRDQREILAWLAQLRDSRDGAYLDRITNLIDDRDPARWHSAEQFKQALGDD